jgi:hypothetical protein
MDGPSVRVRRRRSLQPVRPDQLEHQSLGPAHHAELLHVLCSRTSSKPARIGEFCGYPESRTFAELLIDCEEDRTLRQLNDSAS